MISPKQWNNGGGQHIISSGVRRIAPPTYWALFTMFLSCQSSPASDQGSYTYVCVSIAALGDPVVPMTINMSLHSIAQELAYRM